MLHIDNEFDDLTSSDRLKQRQLILSGKVDAYFAWVKRKYDQVTHNSTIGKSLAYSIHQETYLRTFLSDGNVPIDNNYAEQAIRPLTIFLLDGLFYAQFTCKKGWLYLNHLADFLNYMLIRHHNVFSNREICVPV